CLSFPHERFNLGVISASIYRKRDLINCKKPIPLYSIDSGNFIDIDRGVLKWIVSYKSMLDEVRIK
ncbi:TPA: hypothetical protein ACTW1I_005068, partial [Raoultella planticola]